jgi:Tfp pilus assembly protein PilZ
MAYRGEEKRQHPRLGRRFMVSYRIAEENDMIDLSQTKNVSLGGMLLTTNRLFATGTNLLLEIRLPFETEPIKIAARVKDSKEVVKNVIYDTRLEFIAVDEKHKDVITKTVEHYLKEQQ